MIAVKCQCGAVTVEQGDISNSMRRDTFRHLFPGVRTARGRTYSSCNHCVNGYGIDICGCGSGKPAGKCRGGFTECRRGQASETLGVERESAIAAMISKGGFV